MLHALRNTAWAITLTTLTAFNAVHAAPVGTVQTDFGGREGIVGTALQADGKLVAAGFFYGSSYDNSFALARYGTDGKLDSTFGTGGKVLTTTFAATSGYAAQAEATAVAIQTDGKIVAAGFTYTDDIALARYNSNGSLDTTFGTGGKVVTDWGSRNDYAYTVGIQSTGKIIVGGWANTNGTFDFVMTRYNSNGTVDTTFGTNGTVFTDFASSDDRIAALKIISGDKIVAVGRSGGDMAVVRYTLNGALDTTFNSTGKVTTDFGGNYDEARAVAIDVNGKIVVTGPVGANYDIGLARYTTGGALDSKFGSSGKVTTNLGGYDQAAAIGIDSSGKIIVGGYAGNGFEVLRYSSSGVLDNAFGINGRVTTRISANPEEVWAIAVQGAQVIAAGRTSSAVGGDNFALARYNNNGTVDTTYGPKADLAISIIDSPDPVKAGSNITYSITLTNAGPDAAEGVTTGGLPANTTFVSASSSVGTCSSSTCNFGTLASGATATASIVVMPVVVGTITYTVKADSNTGDPVMANNTATATTSVTGSADVSVTVSGPATAKINENVTYTTVVTNNGPDSAVQVYLTNSIPWQSQFISATTTQGSCAVDCTIGTISAGASVTVTVTVHSLYNADWEYRATASAIADPNTANNSALASTIINSVTDMTVTMTTTPNPVHLDGNLTYNVTVTNLGPDIAYNAHMNLNQPVYSTFVSAVTAQGSCGNYTTGYGPGVECDIGTMMSGASVNIAVTVTVQATGVQTGSARVSLGSVFGGSLTLNSDTNPNNNLASVNTTVQGTADLALTATAGPNPLHIGQDLTYTFIVTNNGPDTAYGLDIFHQFPTTPQLNGGATTTAGCTGTGGAGYSNGNYHSICDRLNSGATFTVTYTFNPQGTGTLNASASLTSRVTDPNGANNSASVTTVVTGAADLAVTLSASATSVRAGSNLTYTIGLSNRGPDTAINTSITDTLPAGATVVSATASTGGSCYYAAGGNSISCAFGNMGSATSASVSLVVKTSVSGSLSNTVNVSSNVSDPVVANNSATTVVTVK